MVSPLVVFDLDGTLVDTAPDLVGTLNTVFARHALPHVEYGKARNMVGGGARVMIERGLAATGRTVAAPELDRLVVEFVDHYAAHIADNSRPFPGLEAALTTLARRGCKFAVCTNKLEWLSLRLLDALGLSRWFDVICGADTFGVAKPDPKILRCTIEKCGLAQRPIVMVGDSGTDIDTARAAQVPVIAVDFGYSETPVSALSPDRVIGHFSELGRTIADLLGLPEPNIAGHG